MGYQCRASRCDESCLLLLNDWMVGWLVGIVAGGGRIVVQRKPASWLDCLLCARGYGLGYSVRATGPIGWLFHCPGAVVDFYFFCCVTMASRNDHSQSSAIAMQRQWVVGDDEVKIGCSQLKSTWKKKIFL